MASCLGMRNSLTFFLQCSCCDYAPPLCVQSQNNIHIFRNALYRGRIVQKTHCPRAHRPMDVSCKNFRSGDTLVGDKLSWPQYFVLQWEMAIALVFLKKLNGMDLVNSGGEKIRADSR